MLTGLISNFFKTEIFWSLENQKGFSLSIIRNYEVTFSQENASFPA